ncbi:MAG: glutaredoxin family protein [Acidiferrobacterales bacterium]|nr:glutaredoxin family protein [Acidiferrobacterales bacterium]
MTNKFQSVSIKLLIAIAGTIGVLAYASAATLYKWVDADGNVVYQDTPPPGNVEFEESTVDGVAPSIPTDTGLQIEEAALENPVSLYTVPVCDSCDLVRLFLEKNAIPFAEKNVRNNQSTQAELQSVSGQLSVPTLTIGSTVLDGFSRRAISDALKKAGFPLASEQKQAEEAEDAEITENEQPVIPLVNENASQNSTAEISASETSAESQ